MSSLDRLTASECGQVSKIAAKQQYPKAARALERHWQAGITPIQWHEKLRRSTVRCRRPCAGACEPVRANEPVVLRLVILQQQLLRHDDCWLMATQRLKYCCVDQADESSREPCVSRFSHMVDVHPPDFFALGLSIIFTVVKGFPSPGFHARGQAGPRACMRRIRGRVPRAGERPNRSSGSANCWGIRFVEEPRGQPSSLVSTS